MLQQWDLDKVSKGSVPWKAVRQLYRLWLWLTACSLQCQLSFETPSFVFLFILCVAPAFQHPRISQGHLFLWGIHMTFILMLAESTG